MRYQPAPPIEERSAGDIFEEICNRLTADSRLRWSRTDQSVQALIRVFARDWEIIASRLNQALDKHFLAYLDYLGVAPVAPTSAMVPLTFTPAANAPTGTKVPERTQVAAPAGGGEPIVFETLRELMLTNCRLSDVFSLDPRTNTQTDLSSIADAVAPGPVPMFAGADSSNHVVYIGDSTVFALDDIDKLTLRFELAGAPPPADALHSLEWFIAGRSDFLVPSTDGTSKLRHSGDVVFERPGPWPDAEPLGRTGRWLGCRVPTARFGNWTLHARRLELRAEVRRPHAAIDAAFTDGIEVDLSKDFYPFGIRPMFGSTFYIASSEAFSQPGTRVTLDFVLTNAQNAPEEPPIPRVNVEGHPRVWWEYWNGARWARLSETDETKAFRINGSVSFQIPGDASPTVVKGQTGAWVRARLVSGNYGEDERWELADPSQPTAGLRHQPSTLAPPSIQSATASVTLTIGKAPDAVMTSNEHVFENVSTRAQSGQPLPLFSFPCGSRPALYLGFAPQGTREPIDQHLTLYALSGTSGPPFTRSGAESKPVMVRWQFWNGDGWQDFDVSDETEAFTRSGSVSLSVPAGARARTDFVHTAPRYWFRIVSEDDSAKWAPTARAILRNTVLGAHRLTLEYEVLGSSHAAPDQVFEVRRTPVLEGELVQVMEPVTSDIGQGDHDGSMPSIDKDLSGGPSGARAHWMTWQAVDDFLESDPLDRHYVVDRGRGLIGFGDGRHGRIPPAGSNNVRLRRYESGGGARGNVPAKALNQLRAAIPSIESVVNPIAAVGGADLESADLVRHRGATTLRHRQRAVTAEDYEDLARLASSQVVRAECIPLYDLSADPASRWQQPGVVSLIIVPNSRSPRPVADGELLRQVRIYLDRRRNSSTELVVVGPEYVQISIDVELVIADGNEAGILVNDLTAALEAFLHPLNGGTRRQGWRIGELPERGDFYGLCASAPAVIYVSGLRVTHAEDRPGLMRSGHFLVCSGRHRIELRYSHNRSADAATSWLAGRGA
ncbi:MAG: putative baseplate assembly protein [Blastocatellia bacterium]|nr:MAG: putative baseplate assembly protein [Blastocatellia bacterium]